MNKLIKWFTHPTFARKTALFAFWISGFYAICFMIGGQAGIASIVLAAGFSGFIIGVTHLRPVPASTSQEIEFEDYLCDEEIDECGRREFFRSEFDVPGEKIPVWRG